MIRVAPVRVSSFIRGVRWSLLILGYYYGKFKKARYTAKEKVAKPKRLKALEEEHMQQKIDGKIKGIEELKSLFNEIELEPEPGWEANI